MLQSKVDIVGAMKSWGAHRKKELDGNHDIRIGVVSSVTADPLTQYLGAYCLSRGYENPDIQMAPYNQIFQVCQDYKQTFSDDVDVMIVLWRIEDLVDNVYEDTERVLGRLSDLASALVKLQEIFSGTVIVSSPPLPMTIDGEGLLSLGFAETSEKFSSYIMHWQNLTKSIKRLQHIDLSALMQYMGVEKAEDKRKWFLYRQPWSEQFWCLLGQQVGRAILAQKTSPKKCIVLDADNTLWGGVVGEDGIGGILLGEEFPGNIYKTFQKYILNLRKKGVLLAVASKNNPDDFFEVLDQHDDMVLQREDFVAFEVHWESKVDSLKRISEALNIGLESIVFVDDSSKEIGEMQDRLPEVSCLQVPEEVSAFPFLLQETEWFDILNVTDEDLARTDMMRAAQDRQQKREEMSEEAFKNSLELEMNVFEIQEQHLDRVGQLINKTNQFNLTTIRRTSEEVEALYHSDQHIVLGMKLKDKYGEYGLVGVAVLEKKDAVCYIDSFLLSCRVLGRNAETAFLKACGAIALEHGCTVMEGVYVPTPKNKNIEDFLEQCGFLYRDSEKVWCLESKTVEALETTVSFC